MVTAAAAAAAAITFLPILTVLFLVVPHGNEEPIKELAAIRNIKISSFLKLKVKTCCSLFFSSPVLVIKIEERQSNFKKITNTRFG